MLPRAGRQPDCARRIAATTSAAVGDFMSSAPRPQTQPSARSPRRRVVRPLRRRREDGVDVGEQAERRADVVPARAVARRGLRAWLGAPRERDLEARALEQPRQVLLGLAPRPGRVDRVEADQPLEDLGGIHRRLARPELKLKQQGIEPDFAKSPMDATEVLQRLIQFDTVNPPGNEEGVPSSTCAGCWWRAPASR